ncbi:MAG: hypothetical protein ABL901_12560 [Hyphomicrobiaceae bacterium]
MRAFPSQDAIINSSEILVRLNPDSHRICAVLVPTKAAHHGNSVSSPDQSGLPIARIVRLSHLVRLNRIQKLTRGPQIWTFFAACHEYHSLKK